MILPDDVTEYLRRELVTAWRPACLELDNNHHVTKLWGDLEWCGLAGLEVGDNATEKATFLVGMLSGEAAVLEHVSISATCTVNLHLIPRDTGGLYVLLLNAQQSHDSIRIRQQAVNEQKLLAAGQARLIERQRDLIGELVEAKAELDHMQQETEQANTSRHRLLAMMSHEFRTPLASIMNYADLARESEADDAAVRKSIETIARSAKHLGNLVDAVIDQAQLDTGSVELQEEEFDLHTLLADLAEMMAPLAAEKDLSFACRIGDGVPRSVVADAMKLRQILINLVGNAIKFTSRGGITILTTFADGRLISSVSDTGPGISKTDQDRVFRAFERGARKSGQGAGLGLTISLRLAELMGGEISLDSAPGQGCTVAVNLPIEKSRVGAADDALPASAELAQATQAVSVLMCDDDPDMQALVDFYLQRAGYGLIVTDDGGDAITKVLDLRPDLVLMDCNLPGTSGVECARTMRQRGYGGPIVALTASRLTEEERAEFSLCMRKGDPMTELLDEIKRLTH